MIVTPCSVPLRWWSWLVPLSLWLSSPCTWRRLRADLLRKMWKQKEKKDEKERRQPRNDQSQNWTDKDTDQNSPWTMLCYQEYTFYNSFNWHIYLAYTFYNSFNWHIYLAYTFYNSFNWHIYLAYTFYNSFNWYIYQLFCSHGLIRLYTSILLYIIIVYNRDWHKPLNSTFHLLYLYTTVRQSEKFQGNYKNGLNNTYVFKLYKQDSNFKHNYDGIMK